MNGCVYVPVWVCVCVLLSLLQGDRQLWISTGPGVSPRTDPAIPSILSTAGPLFKQGDVYGGLLVALQNMSAAAVQAPGSFMRLVVALLVLGVGVLGACCRSAASACRRCVSPCHVSLVYGCVYV